MYRKIRNCLNPIGCATLGVAWSSYSSREFPHIDFEPYCSTPIQVSSIRSFILETTLTGGERKEKGGAGVRVEQERGGGETSHPDGGRRWRGVGGWCLWMKEGAHADANDDAEDDPMTLMTMIRRPTSRATSKSMSRSLPTFTSTSTYKNIVYTNIRVYIHLDTHMRLAALEHRKPAAAHASTRSS